MKKFVKAESIFKCSKKECNHGPDYPCLRGFITPDHSITDREIGRKYMHDLEKMIEQQLKKTDYNDFK